MTQQYSPSETDQYHGLEIAIIGMSGRFPGADSIAEFWSNLLAGKESIGPLSQEHLRNQGVTQEQQNDPNWRGFGAPIQGQDLFDAEFFGYSPREAELLDPQQRLFLECAWHAMEDAAYDPARYRAPVGVFAGAGMNGYLFNLYSNTQLRQEVNPYEIFISNDKDFLTTRVSYKLGLSGPSLDIQTACSTSLVAVHMACQSLIAGECEMALAGGVALSKQQGYRVQKGGIYSNDGHCRPFDANASGTVAGNGVGAVVLKRLEDAISDKDNIIAVIKGSAINNDGNDKVSFTAPSVSAQSRVIQSAQQVAGISPDQIGYVEAHGTGTQLGDPIEIAALTQAFTEQSAILPTGQCAIGSVKSNIGHLDAAAGIAGLIKTALMVKHGKIPESLHFSQPNPQIDFESSPFRVNATLSNWPATLTGLRRAGVSCFGIGGTNGHAILEQPPERPSSESPSVNSQAQAHLIPLAARSTEALTALAASLADHMEQNPELPLAHIAWTRQAGRRHFKHRASLSVHDQKEAINQLRAVASSAQSIQAEDMAELIWLLPGQGSQQLAMGQKLYASSDVFKSAIDTCATILDPLIEQSLVNLICDESVSNQTALSQTAITQPVLFAYQYALAQCWIDWGFQPKAMLGHSLGEWVAACLADVMDLKTALGLIVSRARMMQAMPTGSMLAILAPANQVTTWLNEHCAVAAINGSALCVVSGPDHEIVALQARCKAQAITSQPLQTSHGFHSPAMAPAAENLKATLENTTLRPPKIPFISNVTGTWIEENQATDPDYWAKQMLSPVLFSQGVETLLGRDNPVFLEVGAGTTLTGLVKRCIQDFRSTSESRASVSRTSESSASESNTIPVIASLPAKHGQAHCLKTLTDSAGKLWCHGLSPNWNRIHQGEKQRVSLPGYPYQRRRYWIESTDSETQAQPNESSLTDANDLLKPDPTDWVYGATWAINPIVRRFPKAERPSTWLFLLPPANNSAIEKLAKKLSAQAEKTGCNVFFAYSSENPIASLLQTDYRAFEFNGQDPEQLKALKQELESRETPADYLLDFRWASECYRVLDDSESMVGQFTYTIQAWAETAHVTQLIVMSQGAYNVLGNETAWPGQAALQGLCQVAGQEYPHLGCRQLDLASNENGITEIDCALLWQALQQEQAPSLGAWRANRYWQYDYTSRPLPALPSQLPKNIPSIQRSGRYLIVGEFENGMGLLWARTISEKCQGSLTLVSHQLPTPENIEQLRESRCKVNTVEYTQENIANLEELLSAQLGFDGLHYDGIFVSLPTTQEQSAAPYALLQPGHWQHNQQTRLQVLQAAISLAQNNPPKWCCVQSSMSTVLGGIGLAPYAAANHAVNALVEQQQIQAKQTQWFCINWDAVLHANANPTQGRPGEELLAFALDEADVGPLTERIIASVQPGNIAVSRGDLIKRRQQWLHATASKRSEDSQSQGAHPRPALSTPYAQPTNQIEHTLCDMWQELLRIDQVGIHDSFFDLGGQSLLAIQVIGRLRQIYPVQLDLQQLLEGTPTVSNIAAQIQAQLPEDDEIAKMNALMAEVESLSDEDVAALLATDEPAVNGGSSS